MSQEPPHSLPDEPSGPLLLASLRSRTLSALLCSLGLAACLGIALLAESGFALLQASWVRLLVAALSGAVLAMGVAALSLLGQLSRALGAREQLVERLRGQAQESERARSALSEAQERLVHAHKLEAIGRIAGGIAHDFNNTLTVILSCSELLRSRIGHDAALADLTDQIIDAAGQGADLTKQLLTYSRRQVEKPRVVDVQQALSASERTLARLISSSVRVRLPRPREDLHVHVDPTQLQQAVLNLALNARDAMPDGGELRLEADSVLLTEEHGLPLVRGQYVVIRVRDTGTGMAPETRERVFEPFFTTKQPGLGTGLGLSNVRATVEAAGGHVVVESELGKGSTFTLYFPRAEARASGVQVRLPRATEGSASVLVVDDEPQIREVMRKMLQDSGYLVHTAESAKSALAVLGQEDIDLICTDLMMPDLSGARLIEELRRARPRMPMMVCSAYGSDELVGQQVARGELVYLAKPFARTALIEAVERALSRRASDPATLAR